MRDELQTATTLEHGRWFGAVLGQRAVAQFTLAELLPDLRDEALPEHAHTDAHFILPLSGTYFSGARGWMSAATGRMAIFNPPGIVHRDRFTSASGLFFGLSVGPAAVLSIDPHILSGEALAIGDGEVLRLLGALYRERREWDAHSPLIAEGLCIQVLGSFSRSASTATHAPRWLARVLERLDEFETEPHSIAALAVVAGLSPPDFVRTFRFHIGTSPGAYVRRRKMAAARTRLASTKTPIVDVALSLGYADQSAFTKAFTRANGVSPARFRRTLELSSVVSIEPACRLGDG